MHAMMSSMTARVGASSADSAGMIPSPLNFVWAKMRSVSVVSSTEISLALGLPRFFRICAAEARACAPSGSASLIASSGSAAAPLARSSGFLSILQTQAAAARISGARIRPSLSLSSRSRVFWSNSMPLVGQAMATHSF